jgi:hypothetical protein
MNVDLARATLVQIKIDMQNMDKSSVQYQDMFDLFNCLKTFVNKYDRDAKN